MSKNISDQIVEFLTEIDVKYVYGIPGDTIDSVMESLRKQNKIKFIIMRHEEAAALAASAQAKLTGELAVCVACQGPGAIHLLNGLYDAAMDGAPVLAITGQVPSDVMGTHMPQEINQIALFEEVAVYNQELRNPDQIFSVLTEAVKAAKNGRGVAHVSIPSDVIRAPATKAKTRYASLEAKHHIIASQASLDKATDLINSSRSVTVLYGEGSRDAAAEVISLAERLSAPLVHTTRSKDVIDNHHPHYMGGIGLMGSRAGNFAVHHCELLLVVGSSFAFSEYYPDKADILQIDIDPDRLGRHEAITLGVAGEAKDVLTRLLPQLQAKTNKNVLERCQHVRQHNDSFEAWEARIGKNHGLIHPQTVMKKLNQYLPEDAVLVADVGGTSIWINNFLKLNGKQRYTWSANLASLGTGLPFSIGAQLAHLDRKVVCVAGDGGFNMLVGDFATVVHYNLPVLYIVYNNGAYGFIELEEQGEGNPIFGTKFSNPDFAALAKAYGADGVVIKNADDLDEAIQKGLASKGPFVIDVHTNPKELFIPPVINLKMMESFTRSRIRSWFAAPSKADRLDDKG